MEEKRNSRIPRPTTPGSGKVLTEKVGLRPGAHGNKTAVRSMHTSDVTLHALADQCHHFRPQAPLGYHPRSQQKASYGRHRFS